MLRKGLLEMVRELAKMRTSFAPDGSPLDSVHGQPLDIAVTTNGHLLADLAQPLKDAGLTRVTVSMDAVDSATFARITRVPNSFEQVLGGIRAAKRAGLDPVKVNCVLLRGFNDEQIPGFARFAREEGVVVRFIEFMPLEEDRLWSPATVVPIHEVIERLSHFRPVVPLTRYPRQRNGLPLHLRRRNRRNRHYRSRFPGVLRTMQPRPPHFRRQNPHLPLLPVRPRPLRSRPSRRRTTRNSLISLSLRSKKRKPAITSASPDS